MVPLIDTSSQGRVEEKGASEDRQGFFHTPCFY